MKTICGILTCLILVSGSCSPCKKVSLNNFNEFGISYYERESLHYYLKKHKLHYSGTDSRHNINYFEADNSTPVDSYSFLVLDNIFIPRGATGACFDPSDDNFTIDFGEGIIIPFRIYKDNNVAISEIVINKKGYRLQYSTLNPTLYFDTAELKTLRSK